MKRNKNVLCLILVLTMLLGLLAGCGAKNDNPTDTPPANDAANDTPFYYSEGIDENGFLEGIKALNYVEIFNYQAFLIPSAIHRISENSLQSEIDSMLATYSSSEQITDRAAVNGDTVNIDYVGSVDGVEFEGGSTFGTGTDVTIGVTNYIDDFLEQLIGHMPGETINVEVTFPDNYHEESLKGKDAVFVTTVNYIVNEIQPELTDDFVTTNFYAEYGWDTVEKMNEELLLLLQNEAIQQYINEYLVNEVTVNSIPETLREYQERAMLQYYRDGADYYNMSFDEFLASYVGVTSADELIEINRDTNLQNAKYALVAQAVAEDMGISVNEEDMIHYYSDYSPYVEQYGMPYLKQYALIQKVVDYIFENAVLE